MFLEEGNPFTPPLFTQVLASIGALGDRTEEMGPNTACSVEAHGRKGSLPLGRIRAGVVESWENAAPESLS